MPGKKAPGSRSHAKGASKGNRWAKGHSCVSNPGTTKFRDQASSQFLHPVSDNPLFTVKNVAAIQMGVEKEKEEDLTSDIDSLSISDVSCGTGLSSISTLRSLSSAWSKCSTNAFDRFLKRFRSDSFVHKEMLSILAASSEVINGAGGKLNETEFFATFIALLDSCQPEQYQPVMSLVCIIIGRVSAAVLKLKFNDIYPKIGIILSHGMENNNDLLIRSCIEAIMKLTRVQDQLNLEDDKQLQALIYTILKCCLHEKPRVRRKARLAIKRLVSQKGSGNNSVTKLVLGWILDQLACYPTCETKVAADALTLLLSIWMSVTSISKPGAKKIFEGVLRVMSSGDTPIMKIGFRFFIESFENFTSDAECDPQDELFSKLIVAAWELQPDTRNTDCFVLWLRCILSGLVRLKQGPSNFDFTYLAMLFEASVPLWITNHGDTVVKTFKEYCPHLITEGISTIVLEKCFRILSKSLLSVPPNLIALQILESLLDCLAPDFYCASAQDIFLQLLPLRNAEGVSSAMGKFIRAFGVQQIWNNVDPATRWLIVLPLLNENLNNSELSFWKTEILPGLGKKTKFEMGWESLVGFCRNPKDPENFPAELLGKAIVEKPNIRLQALSALRQFIEWPQCDEITKKYSKNYLPVLFNLYIQTKPEAQTLRGHADSVGTTIQKYLTHCDSDFIIELTNRALSKLSMEVNEAGSPVFDLVAFLAKHVSDKELQDKILDSTSKKWVTTGDGKRAHRIMASLAKNENLSPEVLLKLFDTLKQTPAETKSNAAAQRLDCISAVTARNTSWAKDFLPEVIINVLSVNAKTRKLASGFVSTFCQSLRESGQSVENVLEIIQVGLSSPIPLMVSSTLKFAHYVYKELKPDSLSPEIVDRCLYNLSTSTDTTVWKHSMQLLCLSLQLYKGALGPWATQLGATVSDVKYHRKDSSKLLARMIKVFGAVGVRAIITDAEDPKMRNRIKNICKKLREKKTKEDKDDEENVEEEDESGDDMDIDVRMSNKTPLVMKEGVVDFLNPSDVAKSLINERPAKQEDEFKMSKDGKLIIDIQDPKSKRKRPAPGDSDDEDEEEDEASDEEDEDMEKRSKNKSAASMKSNRSKFSAKSFKSASSRRSHSKSSKSKHGHSSKDNKKGAFVIERKKHKRFKSTSSVKSSSMKSRKSSAASTFRLRL